MNDEISKLIAKVERFARQEQLFAAVEPGRALHLCAAAMQSIPPASSWAKQA